MALTPSSKWGFMDAMADSVITIDGDRQTGKTTLVLDHAIMRALRGDNVLFFSQHRQESHEAWKRTVRSLTDLGLLRVAPTSIVHVKAGGSITFRHEHDLGDLTASYDLHVFDGVSKIPNRQLIQSDKVVIAFNAEIDVREDEPRKVPDPGQFIIDVIEAASEAVARSSVGKWIDAILGVRRPE